GPHTVELDAAERRQYGAWHAVGLTGAHLAETVAGVRGRGAFPLALLGDCNGSLGMLGGLRRAGPTRLGMVWFDAHGDFNTPETTLSGYLGGMPAAVAAGLCLERLRGAAGVEPPLDVRDLVMVALRDVDPLEQELLDQHGVEQVASEDLKGDRIALRAALTRLTAQCDAIYIHIDLDVLDPAEAPGMNFPVPGGPSPTELADAIALCLAEPKAAALGIASYNAPKDEENRTLTGVFRVIAGAARGLGGRGR
ncbi:MAG TPA: arginase family protein, partial [Dehalococcoidia bacterium]